MGCMGGMGGADGIGHWAREVSLTARVDDHGDSGNMKWIHMKIDKPRLPGFRSVRTIAGGVSVSTDCI